MLCLLRVFGRSLLDPAERADGGAHVMLVQFGELEANCRVVDLGREGLEMRQGLRTVAAGLGDFSVGATRFGPCTAFQCNRCRALGLVERARSLESPG